MKLDIHVSVTRRAMKKGKHLISTIGFPTYENIICQERSPWRYFPNAQFLFLMQMLFTNEYITFIFDALSYYVIKMISKFVEYFIFHLKIPIVFSLNLKGINAYQSLPCILISRKIETTEILWLPLNLFLFAGGCHSL